ncbi:MAG: M48 family metallopeptidase [Rubellimicrobium sp.]|nr:M48 family metallopeptidase [Rubellimicrobium sp.]
MLRLTPILLVVLYALVVYRLSVWRTGRELDARSTELADPVLRRLTERMAAAVDLPRIRVHIYEISPINGLAAPDGRIFITRGFHDAYRRGEVTAEELASVIAHELGHVALGHSRRRMIDFSGQNAVRTALALLLNRFLPGIGAVLAAFLTSLVAARMSRVDEYEADAYATALMLASGIGTAPQKSLFRKLEALTGGMPGAGAAWLLSHPVADKRIAAIEANEARWTAAPEG